MPLGHFYENLMLSFEPQSCLLDKRSLQVQTGQVAQAVGMWKQAIKEVHSIEVANDRTWTLQEINQYIFPARHVDLEVKVEHDSAWFLGEITRQLVQAGQLAQVVGVWRQVIETAHSIKNVGGRV